jgi:flagellar basal-body rod modification protein FlgD
MTISAISATTPTTNAAASSTTSSASTASATNQLSYNDFLSLLMAELQNQDPTQPMDPAAMVSQLATVSEVGQAVQTNTTLNSILTSNSLSQAEILVGQNISSLDDSISGTVGSVDVTNSGSTAILTNGETLSLSKGAIIQ